MWYLYVLFVLYGAMVKVTSDQIDQHPAIMVEEGGNVSINCAKTPRTISEWKFRIQQCNGDSLELLYSTNLTELEKMDITAITAEESTDETTGMQTFSIHIIAVTIKMTGLALECGVRTSNEGAREAQFKFHKTAAVLIVCGKGQYIISTCMIFTLQCKLLYIYICIMFCRLLSHDFIM